MPGAFAVVSPLGFTGWIYLVLVFSFMYYGSLSLLYLLFIS